MQQIPVEPQTVQQMMMQRVGLPRDTRRRRPEAMDAAQVEEPRRGVLPVRRQRGVVSGRRPVLVGVL